MKALYWVLVYTGVAWTYWMMLRPLLEHPGTLEG